MNLNKTMTVIASAGLLFGAVVSMINASEGYGIETDDALHEFVLAQLDGDSPQDLTGDPGTGGGGTGTPEEEKHFYKRASRLIDIGERYTVTADQNGIVIIEGRRFESDPYATFKIEIEGYECKDTPNAWSYCDTRCQYRHSFVTPGDGTAEPPTPPAP